jgi:hypothetical protein
MISGYNLEQEILIYAKLHKYYPFLPGYDHGWAMREFNAISSTKKNPSKYHIVWNKRVAKGIAKNLDKKMSDYDINFEKAKMNYKIQKQ